MKVEKDKNLVTTITNQSIRNFVLSKRVIIPIVSISICLIKAEKHFLKEVLVENNVSFKGRTEYIGKPSYKAHGAAPIKLQAHGDPSEPISFKNIWIRPL